MGSFSASSSPVLAASPSSLAAPASRRWPRYAVWLPGVTRHSRAALRACTPAWSLDGGSSSNESNKGEFHCFNIFIKYNYVFNSL